MLKKRIVVKKVNFDKLLKLKNPCKYNIIYNDLYANYISDILLGMVVVHSNKFIWKLMDEKIVYIIEKVSD